MVVPTYNEIENLAEVIGRLRAAAPQVDVLVVDDGSPDGTAAAVRARANEQPRIRILERDRRSGLASAYGAGFRRGLEEGYDLLVEMDADLSHRPDQLHDLLVAARAHHLVIGSRYVAGGSVTNWSRSRLALSRAGNAYARTWLDLPVRDATSGFRVYRRDALAQLTATPVRSDGYGFQVELVLRATEAAMSIAEVPIEFREREHGHSKISRRIVVEALWLVTLWGLRARFRAL
jgi:dolichol-phosphate mannosyltransferase